jgi:threonine/homoserine/homoserine lactone efflux protein
MMTFTGLLAFGAAYGAAAASPGPGVAAILARVLSRGLRGAPAFIGGFLVGDLVWFALAATTLHAVAQTFAVIFVIIRYAGAAYLLYLAWRLWTAPVESGDGVTVVARREHPLRLFLGALSLTLGNPKVIFFFLALLPMVVDLGSLTVPAALEIAALMAVILSLVLGGYALLAAFGRRFITSPRAVRMVNRSSGTMMAGAAVAIAAR